MKIIVDNRWIGEHGIGRFAREVIARLPQAGTPGTLQLLHPLEPLWLSLSVWLKRPDVYFSPGFNPPLLSVCPVVFTLHDLIHLDVLAESSRGKRLYYEAVVKPAARRAHRVLTVSEYSRRRICEWTGLPPERVCVVGNGLSEVFRPEGPRLERQKPYLFYVGNAKPHKNVLGLLRAFARLERPEVDLLLMGHPTPEIQAEAERLGVSRRVEFLGRLDEADLAAAYRGALALAYPTLYEGFGLPALEAMACGTPVLTSNTTSLPEVVGDAAVLVDPESTEQIAAGLERLISDEGLRRDLRRQGLERATRFTWDAVAGRVREVLEGAVQDRQARTLKRGAL